MAIARTPEGYLWLATFGGLARFDGRSVLPIYEDRQRRLWIGTCEGISVLSEGTLVTYGREDGLLAPCVRTILEDRGGALWLGSG